MDAADIMFSLAEAYSTCQTYEDRGLVRHFEQEDVESYRHRIAFKTLYSAPNKAYFEWVERPLGNPESAPYRVNAFWSDGEKSCLQFFSHESEKQVPSLDYAVAASAGLSKGSSVHVFGYLLESLRLKMRTLVRLQEVERLADERVDGISCFHLHGRAANGSEENLYIDQENFLLRRARICIVIKPGLDEAQYQAIKAADPVQAEAYRKFREAQTEERRLWNQIDYHEATINAGLKDAQFKYEKQGVSDLVSAFNIL